MSPTAIRTIWIKEGPETRYKRILQFEEQMNGKEIDLTDGQIRLLERANPCHVESPCPGYLLSQDTFMVGATKGVGRISLQAVVDTYGSSAFGKLSTSKPPETTKDSRWNISLLTTGNGTAGGR